MLPDHLNISAAELGQGQPVKVRVLGDMASLARDFAETLLGEILQAQQAGRPGTFIIPVGPVDQFPILARLINEGKVSCRNVVFINMDEYVRDDGRWISEDHPLSFRAFMKRSFYDLLDPALVPFQENRIFPDARNPQAIQQWINHRGGVDACFGGIGINGHMAFNEPPEVEGAFSIDEYAAFSTRIVKLSRETITINSVTVGGEMFIVPEYAVTIGMKEILASRRLRFYCNRPWQSAVVRRVLHGPLTPRCPASFLRTHPDASITIADYVAAPPQIQLR